MSDSPLERATEADLPALGRMLGHAFASPPEGSEEWVRLAGLEHARLLRDDAGTPVACLTRIPMGQYFLGRPMPLLGIAGVAVAPELRGRGLAAAMMRRAIREIAAEGYPLSGLYASIQSLYRKVGYEQAGHRCFVRMPLNRIDVRDRGYSVLPIGDGEMERVRACYREFCGATSGPLDRGEYAWRRVRELRSEKFSGFGFYRPESPERLEAYVFLSQRRDPALGRFDLYLSDFAFTSPGAGRALLGFLADFATMGNELSFWAGPTHPLLLLLDLQNYTVERGNTWMLRITNLKKALEARVFPAGLTAAVGLDVVDDLLPENAGRWVLRVNGGAGSLEKGGDGPAIRCDIRGVSPLLSGFLGPREAQLAGLIEGPDSALDSGAAVFAGPTPWMSDMY